VNSIANGHGGPSQRPGPRPAPDAHQGTPRAPRRLVLLKEGGDSPVEAVLAEYCGADVSGNRLHTDLQRFASEHPGREVAAEWLGPLGWTRFLWCRK
jgi:hypothetical protein